jgi:hypothetical protein
VCAFLKGKAQEVQGTHETTQEIGGVGHPAIGYAADLLVCHRYLFVDWLRDGAQGASLVDAEGLHGFDS